MKYYYAICLATATLIGIFGTDPEINPFAGAQVDGRFVIPMPLYNAYKDSVQFQRVNWDTIPIIDETQLNPIVVE